MKTFAATCVPICIMLAACQPQSNVASDDISVAEEEILATATMTDASGNPVGIVTLRADGDDLSLLAQLQNIEPGTKAFHLHTTGVCDAPVFKTAGGHLNPDGNTHGKLSDDGKHLGDLPNVEIADDGSLETSISIKRALDDALAAMRDEDGTAVMLHAGPDDYKSDPAGAAGPRIACGVLQFS